jgi:flagellin-like protein
MSEMNSGISPVVATVLLIAIAVIGSVTAWYWISSYTNKPAVPTTSLKGYAIVDVYKNSSKTGCDALAIKNSGGAKIENIAIYIRDYSTGKVAGKNGSDATFPAYVNITSIDPGVTVKFSFSSVGETSFLETNISDEPIAVYFVTIGDANRDGQKEVVIGLKSSTNELRMYENKSGGWVETNISDLPEGVESVAIGDANNDGLNDVVIGVSGPPNVNQTRMYENKTGKWVETNISDPGQSVQSVAIGDTSNDGKNDVITGGWHKNETRMYENKTGKWVETNISNTPNDGVYSVAIGDADNDGKNETIVGLYSPRDNFYELRMYDNHSGQWIETNISGTSEGASDIYSVAIGDANNDGNNDIVIGMSNTNNDMAIRMYENKSGGWIETNLTSLGAWGIDNVNSVAIGDLNHDGKNEVIAGGDAAKSLRQYENRSGGWIETNITDLSIAVPSVAIGDANNDGENEIIAGLWTTTNEVRMYVVTTAGTSSIPRGTYVLRSSTPGLTDQIFTCV